MAKQAVLELRPMPLQLHMVEHGVTPLITTAEAREMRYKVMVFSLGRLAPAYVAIRSTMVRIKEEGYDRATGGAYGEVVFKSFRA